MKKYHFVIQYCRIGDTPAQVIVDCTFDAPNDETANKFVEQVEKAHGGSGMTESRRPYETIKDWN